MRPGLVVLLISGVLSQTACGASDETSPQLPASLKRAASRLEAGGFEVSSVEVGPDRIAALLVDGDDPVVLVGAPTGQRTADLNTFPLLIDGHSELDDGSTRSRVCGRFEAIGDDDLTNQRVLQASDVCRT